MKRLIILIALLLPLTVGALPTVFDEATKVVFTAPTENTDGSPLTDLAGFKIYWSSTSGNYVDNNSQYFPDPTLIEILLADVPLPDGNIYLVITVVNSGGMESAFSPEGVTKKLGAKFYKSLTAGTVPAAPFSILVQ